ncbi:hypothetical protein F5884DRAFT_699126 [Xylogone sp. PMI_703]|nr:hypothetical protein F5884DRAFT_699126 [Xylogone sp. PMI_703]
MPAAIASSRIFVKGLPPTISEDEFRKHFSVKQPITDAKLIAHRRIGYIGYKTPEDAENAVKYFNRTFIRMSKIAVEIARPISDAALPMSRKAQREKEWERKRQEKLKEQPTLPATDSLNSSTKRKRDEVDEADHKLKEFLEVMQPVSKQKSWTVVGAVDDVEEPPSKIQAMEMPEGLSDDEYEVVPKKARNKSPPRVDVVESVITTSTAPQIAEEASEIEVAVPEPAAVPVEATDDDWLRSRTNRLLDLMDPEEIPATTATSLPVDSITEDAPKSDDEPSPARDDVEIANDDENLVAQPETKDDTDATIEKIRSNGRLFVRNLPYSATEDDLREHFKPFGSLEEVHLPVDASGKSKGFLLVQYIDPDAAVEAFHNLDGEPFQGRLLHILPAAAKKENKLDEFVISKLPLKKQKQIKKKAEAASTTFNWNSLYMNQDAVNSAVAERLGVSKSDLLDPTSADAGVKQAIAETSIIQETKTYFANNGVDLNAFKKRERGDTAILVKNFPYGMTLEELRKMFEEFGSVLRVLMPPSGTIAIVEFAQPTHARAAFASLAYRRLKDSVLFLEKAPKDLFTTAVSTAVQATATDKGPNAKLSVSDLLGKEADEPVDTSTLYVRNLNFATTTERLNDIFRPLNGFISARVNTKKDPKKPGQVLSMGFGFVEFRTKDQAQAALKAMDGYNLDNHKLVIKASHRGVDAAEERRKEDTAKKLASRRTKIIIKNLPFEATKKDVRSLFGAYGQLRSVRVPKKIDNSARGFAFADFVTVKEAESAMEALRDTHLLGRRLVLEFAAEDAVDAEEEIERMQKKVGNQVNTVALQQLSGGGRKKFNVGGDEGDVD